MLCDVKRGLGVELPGVDLPDGGFDAMVRRGRQMWRVEEGWREDEQRCER